MTMDSGEARPNEPEEQPPSEDKDSWYFNLPGGAWERQEEKNRELRERVHSNLDSPTPPVDPFATPKKEEKRGFFGRGKKQEEPEEHVTAGGTFRLAPGGGSLPPAQPEPEEDDAEWSSEPVVPLRRRPTEEAALPLPSTEWTADDGAPGEDVLSSMRKWSSSSAGEAPPTSPRLSDWLSEGEPAPDASPAEAAPGEPLPAEPLAPALTFRLNRPEREVEADDDAPSRWKDAFSGSAEESGGLAAMREWAESGPVLPPRAEAAEEPAEIPEEFLKPFAWEAGATPGAAANEIPPESLTPLGWEPAAQAAIPQPGGPAGPGPGGTASLDEHPWEPAVAAAREPDAGLEDLFPATSGRAALAPADPASDEHQGGILGRLFGRKKQHEQEQRDADPVAGQTVETEAKAAHDFATAGEAGWLPAHAEPGPVAEASPPPTTESVPADENPWRWPAEPQAALDVAESPTAVFEAPTTESVAEPADENPWRWPAEPEAVVEVAEPPTAVFEAATTESAAEPADENPWRWPAEPQAALGVAETPTAALESAPPESAAEHAEENPWRWPAEPRAALDVAESATPTFDPPAVHSAAGEAPAEDGWDPEPFVAPVPLPAFAPAPATIASQPEEEPETFDFSFEREEEDEIPASPRPRWEAPVSLAAPEPAEDERPWWETSEDEEGASSLSAPAPSTEPQGEALPLFTKPPPPTLTPTADEDPWAQVASIDSEMAAAGVSGEAAGSTGHASGEPLTTDATDDAPQPWMPASADQEDLALDAPESLPPAGEPDAVTPRPWAQFASGAVAAGGGALPAPAEAYEDLDLASSLESQMAKADDERLSADAWSDEQAVPGDRDDRLPATTSDQFGDDDDVLLRAFNAHAATPDVEPAPPVDRELQRAEDAAFGAILGDGAADIVAEAADEPEPARSFLSPAPWSALRQDTPENPFDAPWETDSGEPLTYRPPTADLRPASDGGHDVPWGTDYTFDDGAPGPAIPSVSPNRTKTVVREVVETVMLALLVFLSVRASFQNFKVDGSSMYPTLENGQFLIVNKLVYAEVDMAKLSNFVPLISAAPGEKRNVFHPPERGDIVVLQDPRKPQVDLIKRVIGLPGETLQIVDGKVYINDFRLDEPYIKAIWHDNKPKILIPPGEYFVMGDNRDNSLDSRSQQVGFVPKDLIIGKAMVSYWPKSKFGLAPNEAGNVSTVDGVPKVTAERIGAPLAGR